MLDIGDQVLLPRLGDSLTNVPFDAREPGLRVRMHGEEVATDAGVLCTPRTIGADTVAEVGGVDRSVRRRLFGEDPPGS